MRKIIAGFACSLDGFIEGPHGEYDWILFNKEIDFAAQMKQYDTFLYGRRTYEAVAKEGTKYSKAAKVEAWAIGQYSLFYLPGAAQY